MGAEWGDVDELIRDLGALSVVRDAVRLADDVTRAAIEAAFQDASVAGGLTHCPPAERRGRPLPGPPGRGRLNQLREEIAGLAIELDAACEVPDCFRQPEVVRARTAVQEASTAVAPAFLSRRALLEAREAVARAHQAVAAACAVSRVLRERSLHLRVDAESARASAESARTASHVAGSRARRPGRTRRPRALTGRRRR